MSAVAIVVTKTSYKCLLFLHAIVSEIRWGEESGISVASINYTSPSYNESAETIVSSRLLPSCMDERGNLVSDAHRYRNTHISSSHRLDVKERR